MEIQIAVGRGWFRCVVDQRDHETAAIANYLGSSDSKPQSSTRKTPKEHKYLIRYSNANWLEKNA